MQRINAKRVADFASHDGTTCLIYVVLAPAREAGRRTVCLNNLKQIGQAVVLYRQDWGGMDPQPGARLTMEQLGLPPGIRGLAAILQKVISIRFVRISGTGKFGGAPADMPPRAGQTNQV